MDTQSDFRENPIKDQKSYDSLIGNFSKIGEAIASSSTLESILQQISNCAAEVLHADPVVLFPFDTEKQRLVKPVVHSGKFLSRPSFFETFRLRDKTFSELIVEKDESLYFEKQEEIENHQFMGQESIEMKDGVPRKKFHQRENIHSLAALILKVAGKPVGLMFLNYRQPQQFTDPVKQLMKTFASYAAVAIKNSMLIEELKQSGQYSEEVVDRIPDPIFVVKICGRGVYKSWEVETANKAAYRLLKYDFFSKDMQGVDFSHLLHKLDELEKLQKALREGKMKIANYETKLPDKNGEIVPISISTAILQKNIEGKVVKTICIAKDLRKEKIFENQLNHLNEATVKLLNAKNIGDAYDIIFENLRHIGYDRGLIALVNEKTGVIEGKRAAGQNWHELIDKINVPVKSSDILAKIVRTGKPELIEDCMNNPFCNKELMQKAGIQSQYIMPLIVEDKTMGTLQIGLTDKKDFLNSDKHHQTESLKVLTAFANQVAVAIAALGFQNKINVLQRTLASIGHEFRSPLHNIISQMGALTYYLEKKYGQDAKIMKFAKIIEEESFRGERQMQNALYSANESVESMGTNFVRHSISDAVLYSVQRFQENAKKRNIRIVIYDNVRKLPEIYFDKTQIEQVISNIVDNAIKYSYEKQNVEIMGEDHGRKIEIRIKDIGLGIPERSYEKIFDGFSRSDILDKTRFIPGTGLGLKIAKEFIENHRGKIYVISKPFFKDRDKIDNYQGYSTTFTMILPKNPQEY